MDSVLRAASVYAFLLVLFRIAGKRTLSEMTTFDFVLLLIVAEATQQGLLGDDFSLTNAGLVITTLLGLDVAASLVKQRSKRFDRLMDGVPVVLVDDGRLLTEHMDRNRVALDDILAAARSSQGVGRLDDIRYAVLERSGGISIIPRS